MSVGGVGGEAPSDSSLFCMQHQDFPVPFSVSALQPRMPPPSCTEADGLATSRPLAWRRVIVRSAFNWPQNSVRRACSWKRCRSAVRFCRCILYQCCVTRSHPPLDAIRPPINRWPPDSLKRATSVARLDHYGCRPCLCAWLVQSR